jgi:hypothetical protein
MSKKNVILGAVLVVFLGLLFIGSVFIAKALMGGGRSAIC